MQTRFIKRGRAKNSNPIWKGQSIFFGWLKITKIFNKKEDAVAWYDRYQQGFRYLYAVAVVWQGYKDALCGGEEWKLAIAGKAKGQADCDYILNSNDYEECIVW